jgi:putative phosphoesterase
VEVSPVLILPAGTDNSGAFKIKIGRQVWGSGAADRCRRVAVSAGMSGGFCLVARAMAEWDSGPMRVVVLSDTHAPRFWKSCPPAVAAELRGADVVLHAGDVCVAPVLDELAEYAPVHVVLGNNDGPDVAAWGAPETVELDLAGLRVAMIHDSGQKAGRTKRLRRRFPDADLVVFGHSHIPMDLTGDGMRIFNPGSPTDRRRQPHGTLGVLHIDDGKLVEARIVPVTG